MIRLAVWTRYRRVTDKRTNILLYMRVKTYLGSVTSVDCGRESLYRMFGVVETNSIVDINDMVVRVSRDG